MILGLAALTPLSGCDRNDDAPPPIVVVTPQPVRGVIAQTSFGGFFSGVWVAIEVPISDRGALDITVNWTSDETWMYVYLGDAPCSYVELEAETCHFLVASETKEPKPRVLYTGVLEAGTYYLFLYNVPRVPGTDIGSDVTETVAIQIGLTVGVDSGATERRPVRLGRPRVVSPPHL
jgi:hypothetical protein